MPLLQSQQGTIQLHSRTTMGGTYTCSFVQIHLNLLSRPWRTDRTSRDQPVNIKHHQFCRDSNTSSSEEFCGSNVKLDPSLPNLRSQPLLLREEKEKGLRNNLIQCLAKMPQISFFFLTSLPYNKEAEKGLAH